ncbi:MAG: PIN domain nuclease [Deltaproteobacteria bacterium]|nr:PIN domain nuclease [Deltaproteobacteria bacterium]
MVLVDTSVWVDFFRGIASKERKILHQLLESNEEIGLCGLIKQEILQGVSNDLQYQKIKNYLENFIYFDFRDPEHFEMAATLYRNCRKKGKTPRKIIDCLIAAVAISNGLPVLHKDHDFDLIAQCNPLKIYNS